MRRRSLLRPSVPAALVLVASLVAGSQVGGASVASAVVQGSAADVRGKLSVMFVGNNWAGTATVVDTEEIAYLPVGDHPQPVRHGVVREEVVAGW